MLDNDRTAVDRFALDHVLQFVTERIRAQHTNGNRCLGVRKGRRRPIHVLGKVKQEDGLDLRFGCGGDVGRRGRSRREQKPCASHADEHRGPPASRSPCFINSSGLHSILKTSR